MISSGPGRSGEFAIRNQQAPGLRGGCSKSARPAPDLPGLDGSGGSSGIDRETRNWHPLQSPRKLRGVRGNALHRPLEDCRPDPDPHENVRIITPACSPSRFSGWSNSPASCPATPTAPHPRGRAGRGGGRRGLARLPARSLPHRGAGLGEEPLGPARARAGRHRHGTGRGARLRAAGSARGGGAPSAGGPAARLPHGPPDQGQSRQRCGAAEGAGTDDPARLPRPHLDAAAALAGPGGRRPDRDLCAGSGGHAGLLVEGRRGRRIGRRSASSAAGPCATPAPSPSAASPRCANNARGSSMARITSPAIGRPWRTVTVSP